MKLSLCPLYSSTQTRFRFAKNAAVLDSKKLRQVPASFESLLMNYTTGTIYKYHRSVDKIYAIIQNGKRYETIQNSCYRRYSQQLCGS